MKYIEKSIKGESSKSGEFVCVCVCVLEGGLDLKKG